MDYMEWIKNGVGEKPLACDFMLCEVFLFDETANPYVSLQWNGKFWWNGDVVCLDICVIRYCKIG